MANTLTWRDEWNLHIDTLDTEHREMVELLGEIANHFGSQIGQQRDGSERDGDEQPETEEGLYAALDRFSSASRRHFEREEEFMRTIDYPGLSDHLREHALLLAELTAFLREMRAQGTDRLGEQEFAYLKQWVITHVAGADRGFSQHYFKICGAEVGQT